MKFILLALTFVAVLIAASKNNRYIDYEYCHHYSNNDDNIPTVTVGEGDILLVFRDSTDAMNTIDTISIDVDKVYFYCKDDNKVIEYDKNGTTKFRHVKLDHPL